MQQIRKELRNCWKPPMVIRNQDIAISFTSKLLQSHPITHIQWFQKKTKKERFRATYTSRKPIGSSETSLVFIGQSKYLSLCFSSN